MTQSKKRTRKIRVGDVTVGGGAPVSIQSMCSTDTRDVNATLRQIHALDEAGCEIVRVAVPDMEAAEALHTVCRQSPLPVVADIHFDHRLALRSAEAGAAKIRINPGNIGSRERVRAVADACRERGIPIRIGVNSGSVSRDKLASLPLEEAMVASALEQLAMLEELDFRDVCLSVKAPDAAATVRCCRRLSSATDAPLHLGVTEAGTRYHGIIKNAVGIGTLLLDGIGDTLRVSLTADPVEEVRAARSLLRACSQRRDGVELISCPTCGRCRIPVETMALAVEERYAQVKQPLTVAVMGCAVNGPGEARAADVGLAGGDGKGVIFRRGEIVETVSADKLLERLMWHVDAMLSETDDD